MMGEQDDKPDSSPGGNTGFGPGDKADEKKKEEEKEPLYQGGGSRKDEFDKHERGIEVWKSKGKDAETRTTKEDEEHKVSKKVTVFEKEWGGKDKEKQQGYAWGGSGDPSAKSGVSSGFGYYKYGAKSSLSYDLDKKEFDVDAISAEGKFSVEHIQAKGEFDIGQWLKGLFGSTPAPPAVPSTPSSAPLAARVIDMTSHGSPLAPGIGSTDVMIGGFPAWRALMDFHACPIVKGVVPDVGGVVMMGAPTVFIDGMMACRMGDFVVEIPGGPNPIILGCPTVMIGMAGSGAPAAPVAGGPPTPTGFKASGEAAFDGLTGEAEAKLGIEASLAEKKALGVAKAGVMIAAVKGTAKGILAIPLWGDHAILLGGNVEGTLLSAGAEASAEAGYTEEKGWHVGAGAKAGVGLGGAGVGFSLGFR